MKSDGNKNTFIFLEAGQDDYSLNFLYNITWQYLRNPFDLQYWDTQTLIWRHSFDWN